MSTLYTTGEIATLAGVTVRTVQYYDSRNILMPSAFSEGGRRLYSEEDLQKLKIICFLREIGLPIDVIKQLLQEEHPEAVISTLLQEQSKTLEAEISERQEKLRTLWGLQAELKNVQHFTVESINDIAGIMKNKEKRNKVLRRMIIAGIIMDIIEVATAIYGINTGNWWPLAVGMIIVIGMGIAVSYYYYKYTAFICPQCHTIFKPRFSKMFFASHTPKTRRLTCIKCGHRGFCVETYDDEADKTSTVS